MDPLTLIAMLAPSLLSTLFGGGEAGGGEQQRTVTTETPPRGYQSPMLGLMDPLMADQLLRQLQSYSGAGMPSGVGNVSPGLQGILDLLGGDWGELLKGYKTGASDRERPERLRLGRR